MRNRSNLIPFKTKRPPFRVRALNLFLTYHSFANSFFRLSSTRYLNCIHYPSSSFLSYPFSRKFNIISANKRRMDERNQPQQNSYSVSSTALSNDLASNQDGESIYRNKQNLRKQVKSVLKSLSKEALVEQSTLFLQNMKQLDKDLNLCGNYRNWCIYLPMPKGELSTIPLIEYLFDRNQNGNEDKNPINIFVPKVLGKGNDDLIMLPISNSEEYNSMPRNSWNIPEPVYPPPELDSSHKTPLENNQRDIVSDTSTCPHTFITGDLDTDRQFSYNKIDLVIVPCVAFDAGGRRMGHGKGYYDTFLSHLIDAKNTVTGRNHDNSSSALDSKGNRKVPLLIGVCLNEQYIEDGVIPTDENDIPMDIIVTPEKIVPIAK